MVKRKVDSQNRAFQNRWDSEYMFTDTAEGPKPVVIITPGTHVFSGEKVSFKCELQGGDTEWTYSWYKTDNRNPLFSTTQEFSRDSVTDSDSGEYTCSGRRHSDSQSSEISDPVTLTVSERPKPVVIITPGKHVFRREKVTFKCELQGGDTEWTYSWYKNNNRNPPFSTTQEFSRVSVTDSDSGEYTCSGRRHSDFQSSEISDSVTLTVSERPKPVVNIKPGKQVFRGEKVTFQCDLNGGGDTQWTYSWYKKRYGQNPYDTTHHSTLYISSVTDSDSDKYTCSGTRSDSQKSEISDPVTLTVSERPKPVVIITPGKQVFRREKVTFKCELQGGDTKWTYSWNKTDNRNPSFSTTQEFSCDSVTDSDSGEYTCSGRRRSDSQSSGISDPVTLTVSGKPKPVLTSNLQEVLTGNSVTLNCTLNLQSEGWKFYWSKHTQSRDPESKENHYSIRSVSVSDGGQYWCRAGRGNPVYYTHYSDALSLKVTERKGQDMIGLTPWSRREPCLGGRVRSATIKRQPSSAPGKTRKLAAASRARSAAPRPPNDVIGLPARFSGNRAEWSVFLRSVEGYMEAYPSSFLTESAKIAFHISLLTGEALSLASELWDATGGEFRSCARFLQLLTKELGMTTADLHLLTPGPENAVPRQSFQEVSALLQALQGRSAPPQVLQGITAVLQAIQDGSVPLQDLRELSLLLQNLRDDSVPLQGPVESSVPHRLYQRALKKPTPTVSVNPQSFIYTGETVTLNCNLQSTGWSFSWYKDNQKSPEPQNTNPLSVIISNEGQTTYYCKALRGNYESEFSAAATVTVKDGDVILDSPVHPVTEGNPLTLHCLYHNTNILTTIDFYKNDSVLQNQTTGVMTISRKMTYTMTVDKESDEGPYICNGTQSSDPEYTQSSDEVTLTVSEKPEPELTSELKGAALTGNSVTLYCTLKLQSAGWKFYWSKDTQRRETETETNHYFIRSVSVSDGGQYRCRAGRGNPVYYTHYSDALWVTVTDGDVILESPVHPVTEGNPLTLHCLYRNTKISTGIDFYKENSILQNQTTGVMTISSVSKSDEGNGQVNGRVQSHGKAPVSVLKILSSVVAICMYVLVTIILLVKFNRNEVPVQLHYRHLPPSDYEGNKSHVNQLLESQIIRESCSPYDSPIVLVWIKDGTVN
ncbi:Fc receptor-like protein 5 [Silurus meridionalis]|nr:Fc receptor-like protein 5 [Silurus meridionalis]